MTRTAEDIPAATLRLLLAPRAGAVLIGRLREHFGSDEAIVTAPASRLAEVRGLATGSAAALRHAIADADPARERQRITAGGARLILRGDDHYPALLEAIPDPPAALWIRGRLDASAPLSVAIVRARRSPAHGRAQPRRTPSPPPSTSGPQSAVRS